MNWCFQEVQKGCIGMEWVNDNFKLHLAVYDSEYPPQRYDFSREKYAYKLLFGFRQGCHACNTCNTTILTHKQTNWHEWFLGFSFSPNLNKCSLHSYFFHKVVLSQHIIQRIFTIPFHCKSLYQPRIYVFCHFRVILYHEINDFPTVAKKE